jgi:hypothetical protein
VVATTAEEQRPAFAGEARRALLRVLPGAVGQGRCAQDRCTDGPADPPRDLRLGGAGPTRQQAADPTGRTTAHDQQHGRAEPAPQRDPRPSSWLYVKYPLGRCPTHASRLRCRRPPNPFQNNGQTFPRSSPMPKMNQLLRPRRIQQGHGHNYSISDGEENHETSPNVVVGVIDGPDAHCIRLAWFPIFGVEGS